MNFKEMITYLKNGLKYVGIGFIISLCIIIIARISIFIGVPYKIATPIAGFSMLFIPVSYGFSLTKDLTKGLIIDLKGDLK